MKSIANRILVVCLIAMFCVLTCNAQVPAPASSQPEARVVERLPDGEYIVTIDNVERRTISADTARRILADRAELDRQARARENLEHQLRLTTANVADLKRDAELATTQAALEREKAGRYLALYEGERSLREQAERLAPRPSSLSRFFDHPVTQVSLRLAVPAAQTWIAAARR